MGIDYASLSPMTRTFHTADLHLLHARISELSGRPFSSVEAMNAFLIKAWNSRVTARDTVYIHGDVCLGPINDSLALISLLAGYKILLLGNHDRPWEGNRKFEQWLERYYAAGFDVILQPPVSGMVGDHPVLFSHFPYAGDSQDTDRFADRRPVDTGQWLIHGHVHEAWRQRGRQINVGVDAWGGKPVPAEVLSAMIEAGPADLPPRPWNTAS